MNLQNDADLKLLLIDLEAGNTATGGKQENSVQPERLSEGDNVYCVYWIHTKEHNDYYKDGYIGITSNFKERMRGHKRSKKDYIINRAIGKYKWDNLLKTILISNINLDQALLLENRLRPNPFIGWNGQSGGSIGVEKAWYEQNNNKTMHSLNTSIGTKAGIKSKDTHEKRSARAKKAYQQNKQLFQNMMVGSKNGKAKLNEEQVSNIKFNLIPKGMTNSEISKIYNVKPYVISFIKSGKTWKHIVCDSPDYE